MFSVADLFDLGQTAHAGIFAGCAAPWDALKKLPDYVAAQVQPGLHHTSRGNCFIEGDVFIGEGTVVEHGAMITGPAIIGKNCEIRHGVYIRGGVLIGDNCVIGHASELKNALLCNGCQVAHINYIGDSILGHGVHLGAGAKLSNFKWAGDNITVNPDGVPVDTGLLKFGALLGDGCDIGCNAVLNPGSIVGRHAVIYPNVNWRGILPANMIAKNRAAVEIIMQRVRGS